MKKGVVSILSILTGVVIGSMGTKKVLSKKTNDVQQLSEKHLALFLMMNQWVRLYQYGKKISTYFEQKGYHEIAIYGMNYVGETLVEELRGSGIKIKYGIDQKAEGIYATFDVVSPEQKLEEVDVVVVTAISFFETIYTTLSSKINCPIVSLESILCEMLNS